MTDAIDARLDLEQNPRLLLAARRVMAQAQAAHEACSSDGAGSAITATLNDGLLMVTGQIDWRQKARSANQDVPGRTAYHAASNISDDILQMLPRCFFSTSRACR